MTPPPQYSAVVLDLDGTLYHQGPLRSAMLKELARVPLARGPRRAFELARRLGCFRRTREELRALGQPAEPLEELQFSVPAAKLGVDAADLQADIDEWILRRPLKHLWRARRRDASAFLDEARRRGLAVGVFSDYPVDAKLAALGLARGVDATLVATDPAANAFKPHPAGFREIAQRLDKDPRQCLFVGDRATIDGLGAQAAGMRPVILHAQVADDGFDYVPDLMEIWSVVGRS